MNKIHAGLVLACAGLLAGCGGAPSEGDLRGALEKQMAADNASMAQIGGAMGKKFSSKLHGFKKIGCKEDGEKAYLCDVEMDVEAPMVGRKQVTAPVRFVKGSDGWIISK